VLEVATPAQARTGIRARRLDTTRRGLDHFDGIGPQERLGSLGDVDSYALARERVAYEDDLAVEAGDAMATVRDRPDFDDRVGHD
jgi:hypothetical protein